jgi:uncharacterized protein
MNRAEDFTELLRHKRADILRVAAKHGAFNVRIFGSAVRGEMTAESDVDILVELEPGRSLLDHAALMIELEELLGRPVDIATVKGLKPQLREHILNEAVPL